MIRGTAMPNSGRRAAQAGVGSLLGSATSGNLSIMPRADVEPATKEEDSGCSSA
jgi:hypothetical protein